MLAKDYVFRSEAYKELKETLDTFERAATALADIGSGDHRDGILTAYRETGGALGGIAECFIAARRDVRQILSE